MFGFWGVLRGMFVLFLKFLGSFCEISAGCYICWFLGLLFLGFFGFLKRILKSVPWGCFLWGF